MLTVVDHTRVLATALLLTLLLSTAPLTSAQTTKLGAGKGKLTKLAPASMQPYAWAPAPPMPTARTGVAAAVLNSKLYVIGGFSNTSALDTVEVFDPATNAWSAAPPLPTARGFLAAAVLNNNIYAIGGFGSTSAVNTVEVFDPVANSWSPAPAMPTARDSLAAAVVNNKLYALGGENAGGTALNTVEVFDPVGGSWSGAPAMPTARLGLAAAVLNNQIYAIGGISGSNTLDTVEVFDPVGGSWSGAPSLPTARQGLAAAVLNNNIYAIGGVTSNNTFLNTVEVFDPVGNAWSGAPAMPTARDYLAASTLNNKIYAVGGFNGSVLNTAEVFTPIAQPGDVIISEFRLNGPGGVQDEFIELYNNTDQPITVAASDASTGWGLFTSDGVLRAALLNGDFIPAHGHFLLTNSNGYSLAGYPAGTAGVGGATGDRTYSTDIPVNTGIALATTTTPANFSTGNRLDAVGPTTEANTAFKEGAGYPPVSTAVGASDQFSFVRKLNSGSPQDTNDNANDFVLISTTSSVGPSTSTMLGAPGPENTQSPIQRNATIKAALIDSGCTTTTVGPNNNPTGGTCPRVRDLAPTTNGPNGTLSIRRTFVNNTGVPVTRLRFRIVDITTAPASASTADLRALSSTDVSALCVSTGAGCPTPSATVTIRGTTLETPPGQPLGGGLNSSLSADVITTNVTLAPGARINVQFLLGVVQGGSYRFLVNVEALP